MLEDERAAFVRVALQARLLIGERMLNHSRTGSHAPRRRGCAVWIMAVRALHEAFVHTVLERHRELAANRRVAAVADVPLLFRKQEFRDRRAVNGMAV